LYPATLGRRLPRRRRAVRGVVIENISRLGRDDRDAARGFNTLVDILYVARTLLVVSAEVCPEEVYVGGDGVLEFRRTVSGLCEMRSTDHIFGNGG
jgi:cell division protein ZapE